MDKEEKNKEIEWLVGSIKRDFARTQNRTIVTYVALIVIFVVGYISCFAVDGNGLFSLPAILFIAFFGIFFLAEGIFELVTRNRIEKVEDGWELLKIIDLRRKFDIVCLCLVFVFSLVYIYLLMDKYDLKTLATNFIYLITLLIISRMDNDKWIWWILAFALAVCLIFLGEVVFGIFLIICIVPTFLFRMFTGHYPNNDNNGPDAEEIKQLRELLENR